MSTGTSTTIIFNGAWKVEDQTQDGQEIQVRKRKVLMSFTHHICIPMDAGHTIMTSAVIAEVDADKGNHMPTFATIVGLPDGRPFTRARNVALGFSSIAACVDYDEA